MAHLNSAIHFIGNNGCIVDVGYLFTRRGQFYECKAKENCEGLLKYKSLVDIGHCRNVRGLGKSMVIFHLFEKLRYSNERSTYFESLNHE